MKEQPDFCVAKNKWRKCNKDCENDGCCEFLYLPRPDCCVAENDEHCGCFSVISGIVQQDKTCGPTCHFFQNKELKITPCSCGRKLEVLTDTHKYDWGGWYVFCNNCVGHDGCGYRQEESHKTEIKAVEAHNEAMKKMKKLTIPEKHQLKIARKTLTYSDVGASCMGGPTKEEARKIILQLTGKPAKEDV